MSLFACMFSIVLTVVSGVIYPSSNIVGKGTACESEQTSCSALGGKLNVHACMQWSTDR